MTTTKSIRLVSGVRSAARAPAVVYGSFLILLLIILAAIFPSIFAPGDPLASEPLESLSAPSFSHWLGTDELGRDVYTRIVHGATPSLMIGVGASVLAVIVGTALGVIAAQGGKWADTIISRIVEILLAIPGILLVFLVVAVAGKGTLNVLIGIALFSIPGYARIARAEILSIRRSGYVESAVSIGVSRIKIVFTHVIPNAIRPVLILATIGVGGAIGTGASLSYLGLGPQPPSPEWGSMLASSQAYFSIAWWAALFPGVAITLTVLTVTVVGQYFQRKLDEGSPE